MSKTDTFFNIATKSETTKERRFEDKIVKCQTPDFGGKCIGVEMLENVSFDL